MAQAIPYKDEKLKNAICFFAKEHEKLTRKPLSQTFLYKYLAFLDFKSIEDTGRPAIGLTYMAMKRGPVPMELYGKRNELKDDCFVFIPQEEGRVIIKAIGEPDMDYFSPYEITEMKRLIEIYADYFVTTSDISEASHESIKAWRKAFGKKENSIIDYDLVFDDDILDKKEGSLTYAEESYLLYKAIKKAC